MYHFLAFFETTVVAPQGLPLVDQHSVMTREGINSAFFFISVSNKTALGSPQMFAVYCANLFWISCKILSLTCVTVMTNPSAPTEVPSTSSISFRLVHVHTDTHTHHPDVASVGRGQGIRQEEAEK